MYIIFTHIILKMQENELFFYRYETFAHVNGPDVSANLQFLYTFKEFGFFGHVTINEPSWRSIVRVKTELARCYTECAYLGKESDEDMELSMGFRMRMVGMNNANIMRPDRTLMFTYHIRVEVLMFMLGISDIIDKAFRKTIEYLSGPVAIQYEIPMIMEFSAFVNRHITNRDTHSLPWEDVHRRIPTDCQRIFDLFQDKEMMYDILITSLLSILKSREISENTIVRGIYDFCFVKQERKFWFFAYTSLDTCFVWSPTFKKVVDENYDVEMKRRIETIRVVIQNDVTRRRSMQLVFEKYFSKFSPLFSFEAWNSTADILIRRNVELGTYIKEKIELPRTNQSKIRENLVETRSLSENYTDGIVRKVYENVGAFLNLRNQRKPINPKFRFAVDYLINILYYKVLILHHEGRPINRGFVETLSDICKRVDEANIVRRNTETQSPHDHIESIVVYVKRWTNEYLGHPTPVYEATGTPNER